MMPTTSFLFNPTPTTDIYTLSLHDALPILKNRPSRPRTRGPLRSKWFQRPPWSRSQRAPRSEEHTSELQSPYDLVCRLLLEKKKTKKQRVNKQRAGTEDVRLSEHQHRLLMR